MLFESAGIWLYLGDLYPESRITPQVGSSARPLLYQWTFFAMTELEPAVIGWMRAHREGEDEAEPAERFHLRARRSLHGRAWLLGDCFSVADPICAKILNIVFSRGLSDDYGELRTYSERALARSASVRAGAAGTATV